MYTDFRTRTAPGPSALAGSSEQNNLVVTVSGDTITFDDTVALNAGKGSRTVPSHETVVICER